MELAELLESEGLDPDELMPWAAQRADALVAELAQDQDAAPLLALLEADASVDVEAVRVAVEPTAYSEAPPISVDELPPPPEQPQLAEGEPEPILETFDTGPIDLGTPEAEALIAATSTVDVDSGVDEAESAKEAVAEEPVAAEPSAAEPSAEEAVTEEPATEEPPVDEDLEEIELDELVEIDDEELEMLEEVEEPDASAPPPPPPPPSSGPPPLAADADHEAEEPVPVRSGDTATDLPTPAIESEPSGEAPIRTGDTAAHPTLESGELPVQTGGTATHPVVSEPSDDFDLDFDED